jgi:hypothetical protein
MLQIEKRTPTPSPFVVVTFGLVVESIESLGVHQIKSHLLMFFFFLFSFFRLAPEILMLNFGVLKVWSQNLGCIF